MSLWDYLKDKGISIALQLAALLLIFVLFYAFRVPGALTAAALLVYLLFQILVYVLDFLKKRTFYREFLQKLSWLDQKYLIAEMVDSPDFYEGELLCRALYEIDKSMIEHMEEQETATREFTEYVEAWIHDVKIPLASLMLMCHGGDKRLVRQLNRIDGQLDQILYYIRSSSAGNDYLIRAVSLKEIVRDAALKNKDDLLEKNIALEADLQEDQVMTDGKWLAFMLNQILNNSVKYAKGSILGGETGDVIRITSRRTAEGVRLSVWDNGIGIPAEDLPLVCRKTFTGANGRTRAKSTGMGLYIVKTLCDRLGHALEITSVRGEYTCVSITFGEDTFIRLTGETPGDGSGHDSDIASASDATLSNL